MFQYSLLLVHFHDWPNWCLHCTKVGHKTYAILWRSTFEIDTAQSRSVTEIERRSVTSRYHGSTISGLQQNQRRHFFAVVAPVRHETSLFHEPALWSKWTQHQTWNWIRSVKFEIVRMDFKVTLSVCCHPKILLLWQRDVTTSPLYCAATTVPVCVQKPHPVWFSWRSMRKSYPV